ncbi:hypothetical protein BASA61_003831 [Batrachochytrium salamandrivorans]|nr:hypothetical protein BASA61_003831 [Batrachochytrium salamandrivorans]
MALIETNCPDLKLIARGKVRDIYNVDEHSLLFVATDRISAFDVIMKSMPSSVQKYRDQLEHRCMLVRKLRILPVEAIVRGYITGSGMSEYKLKGSICDIKLPVGLVESQELPEALFTPSTKAELGDHVDGIIGERYSKEVAAAALMIYTKAREYAKTKGIIIADTKVEFGVSESGELFLADEVLTPDSSRFWPAEMYEMGKSQPSFDKQYLRDYLTSIHFDKKTGVELPQEVMDNTLAKYVQVYKILTGKDPVL